MLQEKSDEEAKYILDVGTGNGHLLFALMDAQLDEAENMTPDIVHPEDCVVLTTQQHQLSYPRQLVLNGGMDANRSCSLNVICAICPRWTSSPRVQVMAKDGTLCAIKEQYVYIHGR